MTNKEGCSSCIWYFCKKFKEHGLEGRWQRKVDSHDKGMFIPETIPNCPVRRSTVWSKEDELQYQMGDMNGE